MTSSELPVNFAMTIDGAAVPAPQTFDVVNPATGQVIAQAPDCAPDQLDAAMHSAQQAYQLWRHEKSARRDLLLKAADEVLAAVDEIAPILTAEQGKPLADAQMEVRSVALWFRYYANLEVPVEVIQDDAKARIEVRRRSLGVVAAITPWNFPLSLAAWKIAPALRAGNTMVLKPSPYTPLATLKMVERLARVLPPGVLNAVSGRDPLGASMTQHPVPRKISFTGSVTTGKRVAEAAAGDLKRVTLELGGNDPAIVLDDADPARIADGLFWSAFRNNGQVCSAIKRVYVPEALYADVVDALAEKARSARVGDGAEPGTQLGPVNNEPQLTRVAGLVEEAVARGAEAVTGGRAPDRPGYFYEPTILAGASDGMRVVDEEQFGPVLPVVPYHDVEEAIARANGTHFGLSGSVWSADGDRAAEVADRLECGTVWINTHLALRPDQPFGGAKWSGLGVENGPWGLYGFTELKVVHRAGVTS
ncbi:aldehyde dehydrogenase family protein [Amycolatopsis sp. GM8]|uniref:aldehyde dehydrogenase family protein n=1 Tax=Amycolatopsis sp. GM8 TaxID=2896530 RepID=UPI001F2FCD72|nr:aldehyde dehydrogenase family protein [Amycolatopsis sp. GM8]